jgi:phage recombination protein Bet
MSEETVTQMPAAEEPKKLVVRFAERYGVEPNRLLKTLKATAFRQRDNKPITDEQMQALLIVAEAHGLNPWTKEIYAFADKDAIIPIVSVDGWARIINEHRQMDGVEFAYAGALVEHPKGEHKPCPAWIECSISRKDRAKPITVREYFDEVYQPPRGQNRYAGPWQTHTKRMLRHKAWIQCARLAFGFAGIYDEDEAERIQDRHEVEKPTITRSGPPDLEDEPAPVRIAQSAPDEIVVDLPPKGSVKVTSGRSSKPYGAVIASGKGGHDNQVGFDEPKAGPPDLEDLVDPLDVALDRIEQAEDLFALSAVLDEYASARDEWSQSERDRFDEAYNARSAEMEQG